MARKSKRILTIQRGGETYQRMLPGRKGDGSVVCVNGYYKVRLHVGNGKYRWFHSKGYNGSDGRDAAMAEQYRRDLLGQIVRGELVLDGSEPTSPAGPDSVTVQSLLGDLVKKYQERERRSTKTVEQQIRVGLMPFFGTMLARDVTADVISQFVAYAKVGRTNATVNRYLAALRGAFRLAVKKRIIQRDMVPWIELLKEADPRDGFIELGDYDRMRAELPEPLRPVLAIAFFSGVRLSECLSIHWDWVDWDGEVINLPGKVTKNGNQRYIPIAVGSELRQILADHLKVRDAIAPDCPWVCFWYGIGHGAITGHQIRDFRGSWEVAAAAIGQPSLLFHDLRRSAIKLMLDAGVPETKIMAISGHETDAVFRRYFRQRAKDVAATGARVSDYVTKLREKR